MCSCVFSLKRAYWAGVVVLLMGSSAWAQSAGYPLPYSGYPYPLSSYSSSGPYWGSVPSYYGGAPLPYQQGGIPSGSVLEHLSSSPTFVPGYLEAGPTSSALNEAAIFWPSDKPKLRLDNRAHIWLRVPADAEVWFNGAKTKQTGTLRYFFSPPLTAGKDYSYQVQVRWRKDGKPIEQKRRIGVRAGESLQLDFN
jgi:uncharacterized protein (TIGR03000 family)